MTSRLQRLPESPVHLERFWIERFHIDIGEDPSLEDYFSEPAVNHSLDIFEAEDEPDLYRVRLRLRSERRGGGTGHIHFDVQLSGAFHLDDEDAQKDAPIILYSVAPSIIYGIARGLIASITGAGGVDSLQLPSVAFYPPTPPAPPLSIVE